MIKTNKNTPANAARPERAARLLEASNSASAHVGVLHVAFMALCAYVLVIVFGTTDLDLLMGKGVKLPVVDVEVPIVGFYAFAPYLVVLVHFNLLLQLQLLSRKLYAFDEAAPAVEGIGGLRDQLHIFPYTYYLIGRPSPIVRLLLGAVVTITLLLLPLATLLVVQLRFLAYQSELVTWAQRFATWSDVALVIALWPVIMDRKDHWRGYMRRMNQRLRAVWPRTLVWGLVWVGFVICWLTESVRVFVLAACSVGALIAVLALARPVAKLWRRLRKSARSNGVDYQRGVPGLLVVLALGSVMPLVLLVDGEAAEAVVRGALGTWFFPSETQVRSDQETPASRLLAAQRHLDLAEQVLLAKEAKPEIVADLRTVSKDAREQVLRQIEPINLKGRSLRGANFGKALLSRADLRGAELQGADLSQAELQGADLSRAQLQGANLLSAKMRGAELRGAALYGETIVDVDYIRDTSLLDIRGVTWKPLPPNQITRLEKMVANSIKDDGRREKVLERLRRAGKPGATSPKWGSCLRDEETAREITCEKQWTTAEIATFRAALHPVLASHACEATAVAKGFIRQVDKTFDIDPGDSTRLGLAQKLAARINDPTCPGLYTLTPTDKGTLVIRAKRDAEVATNPQSQGRRR